MNGRGGLFAWRAIARIAFLAIGLSGVAAAALLAWRGSGLAGPAARSARKLTARAILEIDPRPMASVGLDPGAIQKLIAGPQELDDRRLRLLMRSAASWKRRGGLGRRVVDQVCLVPDADAFLEALGAWDQHTYFPILIDEPAWVLPFLRAFRPARVVRYAGRGGRAAGAGAGWRKAELAVARAWGPEGFEVQATDDASPRGLDAVAPSRTLARSPGVVLSSPGAPMLAGAAALAAGRFQPLIRIDPPTSPGPSPKAAPRVWDYTTVLGLAQAWGFAHAIEARIAIIVPRYARLGDDCDFITVAGDWPYRFRAAANEPEPGEYAFDDILGRVFDREPPGDWMSRTKRRWAFTGRLMGDPAASVAHAMGSLFLQPTRALLWDTYDQSQAPWTEYNLIGAAERIARMLGGPGHVVVRDGDQASLAHWHAAIEPPSGAGLVFLNSTGAPDRFSISGGPGRPADLPSGTPCAVAMIHSFSAADPADPATIAGRWLAQGAYVYFGAMHEPYLLAFRRPRLIAQLIEAGVPLAAAARQGESEVVGHPWRMVFLGDPLYRVEPQSAATDPGDGRVSAGEWARTEPGAGSWPVEDVATARVAIESGQADRLLVDGLNAAIAESLAPERASSTSEWLPRLKSIRRVSLEPARRRILDELVIDVLRERSAYDDLWEMLSAIPPGERGQEVWGALEGCAVAQFARACASGSITRVAGALEVWDKALRQPWPPGSLFPGQLTERAGDLVRGDAARHLTEWRERLGQAASVLQAGSSSAAAVAAERARIEGELRPGSR